MSALESLIASKKFESLGPASRYLALMLWAGPRMPPEGICRMSRAAIVDFTGVDKSLEESMVRLRETKLLAWDEPSGLMWAVGRANVEVWSTSRSRKAAKAISLIYKQIVEFPPWASAAIHRLAACDPWLGARLEVCWWPFPTRFRVPEMPPAEPELQGAPASAVDVMKISGEKDAAAILPPDREPDMAALIWNEMAAEHDLPQATMMHASRVKLLMERVREAGGMADWAAAVEKVGGSDYLCGRLPGKDFKATLDWLVQPQNFAKVKESNFVNRTARTAVGPSPDAERLRQGLASALVRNMDAGSQPAGGDRGRLH